MGSYLMPHSPTGFIISAQVQENRGVISCPPQISDVLEHSTEKGIRDQVAGP